MCTYLNWTLLSFAGLSPSPFLFWGSSIGRWLIWWGNHKNEFFLRNNNQLILVASSPFPQRSIEPHPAKDWNLDELSYPLLIRQWIIFGKDESRSRWSSIAVPPSSLPRVNGSIFSLCFVIWTCTWSCRSWTEMESSFFSLALIFWFVFSLLFFVVRRRYSSSIFLFLASSSSFSSSSSSSSQTT